VIDESKNSLRDNLRPFGLSILVAFTAAVVLRLMGRVWWCKYGDLSPYINQAWNSPHTSQHLFDPYTFTHILHGVLAFWLAGVIFKRLSNSWRLFVAVVAESAWEVLENSNFIIEKYRENTASLDYFGDSVLNSIGDISACALGFWIASRLGWWRSLIFFVLIEVALLTWIRDSFLLNILMLLYPLDSLKAWQMGA
jgi:hypothetical protein